MEKLVWETTIKCPGVADIWGGIRALVKTGETSPPGITCNSTV